MKAALLCILTLVSLRASAQLPYTLSVSNQPYTPLTSASSINNGIIWNYQTFIIPIGFYFRVDSYATSNFNLYNGREFTADTINISSQFLLTDASLFDKGGANDSVSRSPLRYTLSGVAPNRIFKAQIGNAGFHDEYSFYGTVKDSVNMQVWLYEGSNIVELRYGPLSVTHDTLYFPNRKPKVGYVKNYNFNSFAYQAFYILSGNPASPTIDSVVPGRGYSGTPLSSFPPAGTVYRFSPTNTTSTAGVGGTQLTSTLSVYPTITNNEEHILYNGSTNIAYTITSMDGKMHINGYLAPGLNHVDVSMVASGIYILQVATGSQQAIYRFVKQ